MLAARRAIGLLPVLLCGCVAPQIARESSMEGTPSEVVIQTMGGAPIKLTVDRDPSHHKVAAPLTKSWAEIAKVYDDLAIPMEFADHRGNRVGNTRFIPARVLAARPMSTYLRCGLGAAGALADTHRIRMNILTELKPASKDSTLVFTQIDASAAPMDGTSTAATVCTSTGALESAIVLLLRKQVGDLPKKPRS